MVAALFHVAVYLPLEDGFSSVLTMTESQKHLQNLELQNETEP